MKMNGDSFKKIADLAPVMIWIVDKDRRFSHFNESWLRFRGCSLEDELNGNWKDAIFPEDQMHVEQKLNDCFERRNSFKLEFRLLRYDGSYRWIIENAAPISNDDGTFSGYIGTCIDIHEIKELERRKDEFIVAASHELKTPLTSLSVYLHLIDEFFRADGPAKYNEYSHGAISQLNKINSLVEQLLDLSKIQTGTLNYNWSEFLFSHLVSNLIDKMKLLHPDRNIQFVVESDGHIRGDVERLSQAIENLLNNAIKYSDNTDRILVELQESDHSLVLNVTDFGIGIAEKYTQKIFERFFRIPGPIEETYPGMGMGLYLTQKIINKHRGKVEVESVENDHTRFSVKLPLL